MIAKPENLAALLATRVRPFPTRPKAGIRVVRVEDTMIGVDQRGRVFASCIRTRWGACVEDLRRWKGDRCIEGLVRLGLTNKKIAAELAAAQAAERRRENAQWQLSNAKDLAELGAPFTKTQVRKLQAIAAEPKRRGGRP